MSETVDHYKALQVDPEAEPEVIQAAYRRLARKYHPDVTADPAAARRMAAINRAWEVLGDAARRALYDAERNTRGNRAGWTGSARNDAPNPAADPARSHPHAADDTGMQNPAVPRPAGRRTEAGAAPPPGNPSGSVLSFGRYAGWSLGEIARVDVGFLEWLERMPIGRPYRDEIDALLRRLGRKRAPR